ncbi:MAG TPA: DolP-mannose mannosyltransferase [Blastocatellia bacterium]|nr:DolP-mannose mannosyltransferase [Blastocatellia bacterium]
MNEALARERADSIQAPVGRFDIWLDHRMLLGLVILISAVVYAQYRPLSQPVRLDRANWDYFAQVVSRGGVPYRDVVNIKSPLSAYIGAAAIVATRPFGLRDVYAIRLVCFLMLLMTVGLTFLVGYEFFNSRRIGLLAALILLGFDLLGQGNTADIQPKIPMVIFGLLTLWAVRRDLPFLAGIFGMLSALAWQPGLLFAGAAGLAFSRYLTSWRDLKVIKLVSGAVIPLAMLVVYLWMAGALRDFYLWTIHFNYAVYAKEELKTANEFLGALYRVLWGQFQEERIYFLLAVAGLMLIAFRQMKVARRGGARAALDAASHHSIIIAPAVYFAFCAINVQRGADFIPFLPFISILTAVVVVASIDKAGELLERMRPGAGKKLFTSAGFVAVCTLVFLLSVADTFFYGGDRYTFQQQEADVREAMAHLRPGDKVFVHGTTELLVISGLTNASRHIFLDRGKDIYLDQVEPGGFNGWFERLKSERPRIVALSRLNRVRHKDDFERWVNEDYRLIEGRTFSYYVRKE